MNNFIHKPYMICTKENDTGSIRKTKKSSLKTIRNFKSFQLQSNYSMNISGLQKRKKRNMSNFLPSKYWSKYNMTARFVYLSAVLLNSEESYKRIKCLACIPNVAISIKLFG